MWSFIDLLVAQAKKEEVTEYLVLYAGMGVFVLFTSISLGLVFS